MLTLFIVIYQEPKSILDTVLLLGGIYYHLKQSVNTRSLSHWSKTITCLLINNCCIFMCMYVFV